MSQNRLFLSFVAKRLLKFYLFIYNSVTRKWLKDYFSMGLRISNFFQMLDSITCTELVDYILYSRVEFDGLKVIHEDIPWSK